MIISFYTTNNDRLIPQIILPHIKVYEGLYSHPLNQRLNYNLTRFKESRLTHFNIHGSIFLHNINLGKYETVYGFGKQLLGTPALSVNTGNPSEMLLFTPNHYRI